MVMVDNQQVGGVMLQKLTDEVEVKTFVKRVHCPNKDCTGVLEFDSKTRTERGVHGGPLEYRHRCTRCDVGAWLRATYPQVRYEVVAAAETPQLPISRKRVPVNTDTPSVVE
jgi:hypothetical protein